MTIFRKPPPPLSGVQENPAENKNGIMMFPIHWRIMIPGSGQKFVRTWVKDGEGFDNLLDAIESVAQRIPGSEAEVAKQIAKDYGMGLGFYYPELGIVAASGQNIFDRPFAEYVATDGSRKFVCSPAAKLMVSILKD